MKFFNYLFYRLYWWNSKIVSDSMPVFSAILGISVFQSLNIIFILELIALANIPFVENILNNYLLLIGILTLFANLIYYLRHNLYKSLLKDNKNIEIKDRRKRDFVSICYIIITILLIAFTTINAREKYL